MQRSVIANSRFLQSILISNIHHCLHSKPGTETRTDRNFEIKSFINQSHIESRIYCLTDIIFISLFNSVLKQNERFGFGKKYIYSNQTLSETGSTLGYNQPISSAIILRSHAQFASLIVGVASHCKIFSEENIIWEKGQYSTCCAVIKQYAWQCITQVSYICQLAIIAQCTICQTLFFSKENCV